jgi:hypothetical protein
MQKKQWHLIYRGSDHGFEGWTFHSKCDGIPNTITIIQTIDDFIFGGFTPLAWDSSHEHKFDPSEQSFLFSVTNPHNRDFGLMVLQNVDCAIGCATSQSSIFGD